MTYDLIHYFNSKFAKLYQAEPPVKQLPFLTISRETGCGANIIAQMMQENLQTKQAQWKVINKEIIDQAASQLKVNKHRINDIINAKNRTMADEILDALSTRYYKNDRLLRKSITEIARFDAQQGNTIIVGRGGVAVTHDLPKGFHVKLFAPVEWRTEKIMERRGLSQAIAIEYLKEVDKKRALLLDQLSHKKFDHSWFDLEINCATFTPTQIVKLILDAMKSLQLL